MTERTKEIKIKLEQLEWIVDYKPPIKELRALIAYYKNEIRKDEECNHRGVRTSNEVKDVYLDEDGWGVVKIENKRCDIDVDVVINPLDYNQSNKVRNLINEFCENIIKLK